MKLKDNIPSKFPDEADYEIQKENEKILSDFYKALGKAESSSKMALESVMKLFGEKVQDPDCEFCQGTRKEGIWNRDEDGEWEEIGERDCVCVSELILN